VAFLKHQSSNDFKKTFLEILIIDMVISSIWISGKSNPVLDTGTGYEKGRIIRADIRWIPTL
jgi:hypothetical protein